MFGKIGRLIWNLKRQKAMSIEQTHVYRSQVIVDYECNLIPQVKQGKNTTLIRALERSLTLHQRCSMNAIPNKSMYSPWALSFMQFWRASTSTMADIDVMVSLWRPEMNKESQSGWKCIDNMETYQFHFKEEGDD